MTENALRKQVANYLVDYIGIKEGSAKHKKLVNIFNNSHLCSRYSMTVYDAWCATAVSDAFIVNKLTDIFPCIECSCASMLSLAKKANIWVETDSYKPNVGDVVMYCWSDSGVGDCTGTPNHVGIVTEVTSYSFRVIEGNKNDTVAYRTVELNAKYIRGFITPNYKSKTEKTKTVNEIAKEVVAGKWGNGSERKAAIEKAGYDYVTIQKAVNKLMRDE